jgi:hypothetical protein
MESQLSDRESVIHGFKLFMENDPWDDTIIEVDHYDDYTRQLFVTAVGKWDREKRLELEAFLRNFSKKVKVSTIVYGEEINKGITG